MKLSMMSAAALAFALPLSAQTYSTAPAGDGCGGATLTVTFTPTGAAGGQRMEVRGDGLFDHTMGGMVFGITPAVIGPVLSPGCFLLTEPIFAHTFMSGNDGSWTWERAWPVSALGFYFIQVGSLAPDTLEVRFTNCVRASHE